MRKFNLRKLKNVSHKSKVGVVFTLICAYFVVYFATYNVNIYLPVSNGTIDDEFTIVLDAGQVGYV